MQPAGRTAPRGALTTPLDEAQEPGAAGDFARKPHAFVVARRLLVQSVGSQRTVPSRTGREGGDMLWTIFAILLILWLLGMVSSYTMGGFIHILLVIALVVAVISIIQGRRVV